MYTEPILSQLGIYQQKYEAKMPAELNALYKLMVNKQIVTDAALAPCIERLLGDGSKPTYFKMWKVCELLKIGADLNVAINNETLNRVCSVFSILPSTNYLRYVMQKYQNSRAMLFVDLQMLPQNSACCQSTFHETIDNILASAFLGTLHKERLDTNLLNGFVPWISNEIQWQLVQYQNRPSVDAAIFLDPMNADGYKNTFPDATITPEVTAAEPSYEYLIPVARAQRKKMSYNVDDPDTIIIGNNYFYFKRLKLVVPTNLVGPVNALNYARDPVYYINDLFYVKCVSRLYDLFYVVWNAQGDVYILYTETYNRSGVKSRSLGSDWKLYYFTEDTDRITYENWKIFIDGVSIH